MSQGQVYMEEQSKLPELGIYLGEGAKMPVKGTEKSTCYDLIATSVIYNEDKGRLEYGTGIFMIIPEGYEVKIYPRSSISDYDLFLCNHVGVIDEDYPGELKFRFKPTYDFESAKFEDGILRTWREGLVTWVTPTIYKVGDKIGQFEVKKKEEVTLVQSLVKRDSNRGGFGSTGK